MRHDDGDDREIRELFERAREADGAAVPDFHTMLSGDRRPARRSRIRTYAWFGFATSAAVGAWLVIRVPSDRGFVRSAPQRPDTNEIAVDSARSNPRESTPAAPASSARQKKLDALGGKASSNEAAAGVVAGIAGGVAGQTVPVVTPTEEQPQYAALEKLKDVPIPGRFYQNVIGLAAGVEGDGTASVRGSRVGDFKIMAGGVESVDAYKEEGAAFNTESYAPIRDNEMLTVKENPLSTFSIDVDTASYSNVRRFLKAGQLPPRDAVRVEELINYFPYDDPPPTGNAPFSANVEVASCPWKPEHRLARIGLKGREIVRGESKGSNLVFLIDVSGSMDEANKLPLVQKSLGLLVDELQGSDEVAIVVYAGASGVVLSPTPGSAKAEIRAALDRLQAGGGTNGGQGIALAYKLAREHFIAGGVNRVILATDGDFNLGITTQSELLGLIEKDAHDGIFLTVLGFGMGNLKDSTLELLADRGNGNYAYIDDLREARKVLVEQIGGTLVTIAKDVKIQVEFNPAEVAAYRLIGYENRMLRKEDFNDDRKDAGEIGAGHTVTALYEIVPAAAGDEAVPAVDALKYQGAPTTTKAAASGEMFTLKLRYKEPESDTSKLLSFPVADSGRAIESASADFKFAAAVADFGLMLRTGAGEGAVREWAPRVSALASQGARQDPGGYRAEFLDLVARASAAR